MYLGIIQLVKSLNRTKRLTLLWVKENSFYLIAFDWDIIFFSALDSLKHWIVLGFEATGLRLELRHQHLWGPSLPTLHILGLVHLHNCMSQFPAINLFIYTANWLFLWGSLLNTPRNLVINISFRIMVISAEDVKTNITSKEWESEKRIWVKRLDFCAIIFCYIYVLDYKNNKIQT